MTFTAPELLQLARYLEVAADYLELSNIGHRANEARHLRERILNEPVSRLRPTGDAYCDTLVSERLSLRAGER